MVANMRNYLSDMKPEATGSIRSRGGCLSSLIYTKPHLVPVGDCWKSATTSTLRAGCGLDHVSLYLDHNNNNSCTTTLHHDLRPNISNYGRL
jgi:hypothetical protein